MKGGTRKRGSTWSYYFDMGTIDGKRQKKEKGGFKTKKEAETALSKALNEYNNAGIVFEPASITLADYLDHWIENYCMVNLKSNTIKSYGQVIDKHIKPKLGKYRLKAITAAVIQKWLNQLKSDGYSKSSIILYRDILSCALTYAVHPLQYIQFNPCAQVRLPKFERVKEETRFIISPENFQRIHARFDGTSYYVPLMIGYYTGMRLNEVFALTWNDIDLKAGTISVTKTMIREKPLVKGESPWFFNSAKSEASSRTVKFGDTLHKVLKDAHHSKNLNRMKDGPNFLECYYEESISKNGDPVFHLISHKRADNCKFPIADMVCVRENGKYLPSDTMQHIVNRIINQELGIKFNFHSLRHTHATMLIENGVSLKAVQERLGHANITVTMSIYNHLTEKQEDEAVNIFEQISKIL